MSVLVLIRHGQSQWNLENRFTGWSDQPLTPQGEKDAGTCGEHLRDVQFDMAFTSRLQRANKTLEVIAGKLGAKNAPVVFDSALNERHYGDLQGLNKAETAAKYGQEQVQLWRRSYSTRPPNGESMEDCERRTLPFFLQYIKPHLADGKNVLIVAHGNSLRPIIKYLENIAPDKAATMEIGLCTPYIYHLEGDRVTKNEVREIPGIVTKGASLTETTVTAGRV